jgi:hypothetical protein
MESSGRKIFIIMLFSPLMGLSAQNLHSDNSWCINLGAGPALVGTDFAMSAGMEYCYQFQNSEICARIIGITNKNPTIQKISPSAVDYKITDYGVLYGPVWRTGGLFLSLSTGIGLARVTYETDTEIRSATSISMPVDLQWFWRPAYFAGIGMCAYAGFNFEKRYAGVLIFAQLGVW